MPDIEDDDVEVCDRCGEPVDIKCCLVYGYSYAGPSELVELSRACKNPQCPERLNPQTRAGRMTC